MGALLMQIAWGKSVKGPQAPLTFTNSNTPFELFGPLLTEKLRYYPTVTREPFRNRGRITDLITSEQLFGDLDLSPLDIETDRIMMCGSPGMLEELRQMFEARGFLEGSHSEPGHFVIEKAFVER